MQSDPAPGGALTPGIVFENLQAYQRTAALKARCADRPQVNNVSCNKLYI